MLSHVVPWRVSDSGNQRAQGRDSGWAFSNQCHEMGRKSWLEATDICIWRAANTDDSFPARFHLVWIAHVLGTSRKARAGVGVPHLPPGIALPRECSGRPGTLWLPGCRKAAWPFLSKEVLQKAFQLRGGAGVCTGTSLGSPNCSVTFC